MILPYTQLTQIELVARPVICRQQTTHPTPGTTATHPRLPWDTQPQLPTASKPTWGRSERRQLPALTAQPPPPPTSLLPTPACTTPAGQCIRPTRPPEAQGLFSLTQQLTSQSRQTRRGRQQVWPLTRFFFPSH